MSLYYEDYHSAERTFQLVTQMSGRAGRAEKKGRALIQTLNPRHNVFFLAARQDYPSFFEGEIALRRAFRFPPFCQLAVFTLAHEKEPVLQEAARALRDQLAGALQGEFSDVKLIVYGPFNAPIYRIKNVYRKRFIIKYKNNARTRALFDRILTRIPDPSKGGARVTLDIGPGLI